MRLRLRAETAPGLPRAVPVTEGGAVPAPLATAAAAAGFGGRAGECLRLVDPPVLLAGVGAPTAAAFEAAGALIAAELSDQHRAVLDARGRPAWAVAALAMGAGMRAHRVDHLRAAPMPGLRRLDLWVEAPDLVAPALARTEAALAGASFARDLAAEPANRLTPPAFASRLQRLDRHGLEVTIHGRGWLRRHGYGALLAVGSGSAEPPCLAVLRWPGTVKAPPVALVGKGITFDTGGISIKPASGMEAMKADMAGAAACAGAMLALALRRAPTPVTAVLAIAENATGAASYRPSDVIRTASGRTVEVVDTDAEGRLVLADALHHARGLEPRAILDLATLTGSIIAALGHQRAGLFGNEAARTAGLRDAVLAAGEAVGEPLWPMPIGDRHRADLRSDIADLRHCLPAGGGQGWGGRLMPDAAHAAAFLREFAGEKTPWTHLDIAGMDLREEGVEAGAYPLPPGPSGFGARLVDRLVADHFDPKG
ncbi:leucyl aminopeptidase family protein [Muricoccus radiodurans]|uniref:leucyl aminopeptidase family protein n=1 Tax=Muricoccus radiodurans TaxID=2231721 RepID=UPI003CEB5AAA